VRDRKRDEKRRKVADCNKRIIGVEYAT